MLEVQLDKEAGDGKKDVGKPKKPMKVRYRFVKTALQ